MPEKHIAMCGLDCAQCSAFIATKNNDDKLREKTAEEWTKRYSLTGRLDVEAEDINCSGCLSESGLLYRNCLKCEIRKCGLGKMINNCEECGDYECDKLVELRKNLF